MTMRLFITLLAGVLGSLASLVAQTATVPDGPRSSWDGVFTESQARRGRTAFERHCADCHKPSAFKVGYKTAYELFVSRDTMPETAPGMLSAKEYTDLIAYVLESNGMPSGSDELKAEPDALKQIRIDSEKPEGR